MLQNWTCLIDIRTHHLLYMLYRELYRLCDDSLIKLGIYGTVARIRCLPGKNPCLLEFSLNARTIQRRSCEAGLLMLVSTVAVQLRSFSFLTSPWIDFNLSGIISIGHKLTGLVFCSLMRTCLSFVTDCGKSYVQRVPNECFGTTIDERLELCSL